jgi:uncharacterized protein
MIARRRFGRTELSMPVFSLGGMRYQHKWQDQPLGAIPAASQENLEATVRRALELGIVHIETARGYGTSERQLGALLPKLPRDAIILQTKIAPCENPAEFERSFLESLERLQVDHVDLLALHGINDAGTLDWSIRKGGCFEAAERLRARGKVRFIGFSTHAPLPLIQTAIRHGGFDYVNLHFYFILQRNWPAIVEANQRDMGVFIISPSDKGGKLYAPPDKLRRLCAPLSPIAFNDVFCLSNPEIHTLSIGAARPSDLDEHVAALQWLPNALEVLPEIVERLAQSMHQAIGNEDPEAVTEGLPEWYEAPGGLNLRTMLWLYNLAVGWDMIDYGKMRFNMLGSGDHWFPGASPGSLASIDASELRRAAERSPYANRVPELLARRVALLGGAPLKRLSRS